MFREFDRLCDQMYHKERLAVESVEAVADKGYESRQDIKNCLMNGKVLNVALKYDKRERTFNFKYIRKG